jgi:hypothetical protein
MEAGAGWDTVISQTLAMCLLHEPWLRAQFSPLNYVEGNWGRTVLPKGNGGALPKRKGDGCTDCKLSSATLSPTA